LPTLLWIIAGPIFYIYFAPNLLVIIIPFIYLLTFGAVALFVERKKQGIFTASERSLIEGGHLVSAYSIKWKNRNTLWLVSLIPWLTIFAVVIVLFFSSQEQTRNKVYELSKLL